MLLSAVTFLLGSIMGMALAEDVTFDEYEVKAAYLYHFGQFITWPDEETDAVDTPLVIGILGEDPFGDKLDARLAQRTVRGRDVEIRRFPRLEDLRPCHILFVSNSEDSRLQHIFSRFAAVSTLLVGESPRFAEEGGTIGFRLESEAVRFTINADRAGSVGLQISSKLLGLATIVKDAPRETDTP